MKLVVATDCAGDSVARGEIAAHWFALGGKDIAVEQLPVALSHDRQPEAASVAAITLYRSLVAATNHIGRAYPSIGFAFNCAARDGSYPNGVPFCWFEYEGHIVTAPYNGQVLDLVRRYLGVTHVEVLDIAEVMTAALSWVPGLTTADVNFVAGNKFRSLWFQLRCTAWLLERHELPSQYLEVPAPAGEGINHVSFVDGFGNVFFNHTASELGLAAGTVVRIPRYGRDGQVVELVDVPCRNDFRGLEEGDFALLVGYQDFPMLVRCCDSAKEHFNLKPGQAIELSRQLAATNGHARL